MNHGGLTPGKLRVYIGLGTLAGVVVSIYASQVAQEYFSPRGSQGENILPIGTSPVSAISE
jgi:hypothetical protein